MMCHLLSGKISHKKHLKNSHEVSPFHIFPIHVQYAADALQKDRTLPHDER